MDKLSVDLWIQLGLGGAIALILYTTLKNLFGIARELSKNLVGELKNLNTNISGLVARSEMQDKKMNDITKDIEDRMVRIHDRIDETGKDIAVIKNELNIKKRPD